MRGLSPLSRSSTRNVQPAWLGSHLENVAETKPMATRQGFKPGTGGFSEPKVVFHPEVGTAAPVTLAVPLCFLFSLSSILLFPFSLSESQARGEKVMVVVVSGWLEHEKEEENMVDFLVFLPC